MEEDIHVTQKKLDQVEAGLCINRNRGPESSDLEMEWSKPEGNEKTPNKTMPQK